MKLSTSLLFLFLAPLFLVAAIDSPKVTYLGVHTQKLSPGISHQLNFPLGIYLEVILVGQGSPAEIAGLQNHDILKKFDDQILINQDQLKQLVQMRSAGDSVSLLLVRNGKEKTLTITLSETTASNSTPREPFQDPWGQSSRFNDKFFGHSGMRDLLYNFDNILRNNFRNRPFDPSLPNSHIPGLSRPQGTDTDSPVHQPGSQVDSFTYSSTENQMTVSDEKGTLHYTEKDGEKFLRATNPSGKLIFEGPVNTEQQRQGLPGDLRSRLENLEAK